MGGKSIVGNLDTEADESKITFLSHSLEKGEKAFESCHIKGVIFDCYQTLIDIHTEEHSLETYQVLSAWLAYQGVKIEPKKLWDTYILRYKIEWSIRRKYILKSE
jgi:Predicted hydrolase (HAD superfamily)